MEFFNSKIEIFDPCSRFFVTSEKFNSESPRLFTLRKFDPETGRVASVSEFQAFKTKQKAWDARLGYDGDV